MSTNITYAMSNFDIVIIVDGKVTTVGLSHPMYLEICKAFKAGERERAVSLLDVKKHVETLYGEKGIEAKVEETPNGAITIKVDGHTLDGEVAKVMVMYKQAGLPFTAIVKFWKKFMANVKLNTDEEYVRKQDLIRFLKSAGLYILPNGNFIAYKGVNAYGEGGNGKQYRSQYRASFIYEIDKVAVEPAAKDISDVHVACGVGLHAGSIGFAKSYGQYRLAVEIDPADVVTVPSGSDSHLRCWRLIPRCINPDDTAPVKNFFRLDRAAVVGKVVETDEDGNEGAEKVEEVTIGKPETKRGIKMRLTAIGPNKIAAIKVVRELYGLSLADAKEFVETVPHDLKDAESFEEASRIVQKFRNEADATCIVISGSSTKTTAATPKKRDRSNEKKKVRWYKAAGGKLLCERKIVQPGPEWSCDKAAVIASMKMKAPTETTTKKTPKVKVAVMKALAPKRTYYRVLADGKTVETVRAEKRPPGFTGDRPKWFTKK